MRKDNNIEVRATKSTPVVSQDSRTVEGYAVVFNSQSEDLGFYETINPAAITEEVLMRSDVFCLFNHDQDKVLARSKNGTGSLQLQLDERGLKYTFTAPNTDLGNELLEYLRRGDIDSSSFAFTVSTDEGSEVWTTGTDGRQYREILKIDELHDVSPVWNPAYSSTSVSQRTLDKLNQLREMQDEKKKELQEETVEKTDEEVQEEVPTQEEVEKKNTDTEDEEDKEVQEETVEKSDEEVVDEDKDKDNDVEGEDKEDKEETRSARTHKHININTMKEQRFSLLRAIRNVAENRQLDNVTAAVCNEGMKEMRAAGLNTVGQIYIPTMETRAAVTVASEGADVVATDLYDIIEPLRAKNVLVQAGAKFYTGLTNSAQIPVMTGSNVNWAGETAAATDGNVLFNNVTLTPKRLTAYVDISKMLLAQDSVGVENAIRQDLINAINSKLESTILGKAGKTANQPAGIFNGKTPTKVTDFEGLVGLEAKVEEANVLGGISYIASPSARASFRNMMKGSKGTAQLAYMDGTLDGTPVFSTSNVEAKTFVVGDFSNLAIGSWGGLDIVVDNYTQAVNGMIRLVVNAYFDAALIRPEAFQFGTFAV
ncbi:phage major capsid protein [Prevotella fusca]|uniref:Phage major capsid protein n=2 Tax=Prevotella fusca JCM 17724 TaxID=1236517 RepID=A0ABX7Y0X6_9BACT|nr:phage major capsid protein [Prevotella fusca]QUB87566.1 phage major capsid protein [Prevotella fusca JCM 17724]